MVQHFRLESALLAAVHQAQKQDQFHPVRLVRNLEEAHGMTNYERRWWIAPN